MADNTQLSTNIGTGDVIASDDIGGVKYPRGKIVIGADGTNDGDISATNPLPIKGTGTAGTANAGVVTVQGVTSMTPVQVGDNSGSLTVDNAGTFATQATQAGTWTVTGAGGTFPVTDSGGSLTVDAPVGTPVFVRLSDGTSAIATLPVSLASVPSHAVTNAGTFAVQVDGDALTSLQLLDNAISGAGFNVTQLGGVNVAMNTGVRSTGTQRVTIATDDVVPITDNSGSLTVDNAGTFAVQAAQSGAFNITNISGTISLPTGAATSVKQPALGTAGSASTDVITIQGIASGTVVPVSLASVPSHAVTNAGTFAVQQTVGTSGGASLYSFLSTAAVQAAAVKASAGQVYGLHFFNVGAAAVYVRLYNQTGSPGTGDTVVYRAMVPGNTAAAGFVVNMPAGIEFSTGIGIRVSAAIADNDATALSANQVTGNVLYK